MSQESDTFTSLGWSDVWASVLTQAHLDAEFLSRRP
jgi:hypothetical protein